MVIRNLKVLDGRHQRKTIDVTVKRLEAAYFVFFSSFLFFIFHYHVSLQETRSYFSDKLRNGDGRVERYDRRARDEPGRETKRDSVPGGGGSKPQNEIDQKRCRSDEARKRTQQIKGKLHFCTKQSSCLNF